MNRHSIVDSDIVHFNFMFTDDFSDDSDYIPPDLSSCYSMKSDKHRVLLQISFDVFRQYKDSLTKMH